MNTHTTSGKPGRAKPGLRLDACALGRADRFGAGWHSVRSTGCRMGGADRMTGTGRTSCGAPEFACCAWLVEWPHYRSGVNRIRACT